MTSAGSESAAWRKAVWPEHGRPRPLAQRAYARPIGGAEGGQTGVEESELVIVLRAWESHVQGEAQAQNMASHRTSSLTLRGGHEMLPDLTRITRKASADPTCRFTALAHCLNEEFLLDSWVRLNQRGTIGVDRQTMQDFDEQREVAIGALVEQSRRHDYQAPPVRRVYIPKPGQPAKRRPLGIPTVADRLMQAAVARILSAIYEADFLESSYGFRPGRNTHDALGAIENLGLQHPIHWVFEADIRGFFDHLDHHWLERMLSLRIGDPWILRLIGKWLRAPIDDHGTRTRPDEGAPQGGRFHQFWRTSTCTMCLTSGLNELSSPSAGEKPTWSGLPMILWCSSRMGAMRNGSPRPCHGVWRSSH